MASTLQYVFVGNRGYVLNEMIKLGIPIKKVFVMSNSFLHKQLARDAYIDYTVICTKKELMESLKQLDFDVLVSNGCKYILPITDLKRSYGREDIKFINIHPSCLPDLKGMDPINGACLFNRDGGATCHVMDDGIDTGPIISRIRIPMSDDIDAGLLFQLSFKAEAIAFKKAYELDFIPQVNDVDSSDSIYYSISNQDLVLDCEKGVDYLLNQARAFGYRSKGISVKIGDYNLTYYRAEELKNTYIVEYFKELPEKQVGIAFEDCVVFKLDERIVRLSKISIDNAAALEGLFVN